MKYGQGTLGRVFVARFEHGDDVLAELVALCRREEVRSATVQLIGGMQSGKFVVGPRTEQLPPEPEWRELGESHEVLAGGTVFWDDEGPRVHIHGAFGKHDRVRVGCLRENSETFLVLEAIIVEITGVDARRRLDPLSGMKLLDLPASGATDSTK